MKLLEKVNRRLLGKGYPGREAVAENFRILNTEKQADGKVEEFYREKLKLLALVLLGGRVGCERKQKLPVGRRILPAPAGKELYAGAVGDSG